MTELRPAAPPGVPQAHHRARAGTTSAATYSRIAVDGHPVCSSDPRDPTISRKGTYAHETARQETCAITASTRVKKLLHSMRTMSTRTMTIAAIGAGGVAVMLAAVSSNVHPDNGAAAAPLNRSTTSAMVHLHRCRNCRQSNRRTKRTRRNRARSRSPAASSADAESFRLKDTAGESAPQARSWKSGFLKKGRSSVEVIDASNHVKLPAHVGQRVSVTGTLVDREMQVRSLQRVAASCSVKS